MLTEKQVFLIGQLPESTSEKGITTIAVGQCAAVRIHADIRVVDVQTCGGQFAGL